MSKRAINKLGPFQNVSLCDRGPNVQAHRHIYFVCRSAPLPLSFLLSLETFPVYRQTFFPGNLGG